MASLEDGMSEFERERFMHDFVINNCIYKGTVASLSDGWEYFLLMVLLLKARLYVRDMQNLCSSC